MELKSVNTTQARGLKKLGFNNPVRKLFIIDESRKNTEDELEIPENWNAYDGYLSKPSVVFALEWLRTFYGCNYEVVITDWEKEIYSGRFITKGLTDPQSIKEFSDRNDAESELLSCIIKRLLTEV